MAQHALLPGCDSGTLMERRALGDRRPGGNPAFEQMVADHLRVVYRTAVRLAGRTQDAEDLAQDTFLRAWRSRHTFQPDTNAKAWLLRILHNVNIDRFRAGRRMASVMSELDRASSAFAMPDTPESLVLHDVMDAEVFEALRGLPERFRRCLILADLRGHSYAEIAKGLGVPPGTVMSRLFRARRRLQRSLRSYVRNRRLVRGIREAAAISLPARSDSPQGRRELREGQNGGSSRHQIVTDGDA